MISKLVASDPPELLDPTDKEAIDAELTGILYDNALRTNIVVLCAVLIIIALFQHITRSEFILFWGAGMSLVAIRRLYLLYRYRS